MDEENSSFVDVESVGAEKILQQITTARPKVKCEHCGYASRAPNHVRDHLLECHYRVMMHKCQHRGCSREFSLPTLLQRHERRHHNKMKKEDVLVCEICRFQADSQLALRRHQNFTRSKDLPWTCSTCSFAASTENELQEHVKTTHRTRKFVCGICGRRFTTASKVKCHVIRLHFENFKFGRKRGKKNR